jgi:hypothetical protein
MTDTVPKTKLKNLASFTTQREVSDPSTADPSLGKLDKRESAKFAENAETQKFINPQEQNV